MKHYIKLLLLWILWKLTFVALSIGYIFLLTEVCEPFNLVGFLLCDILQIAFILFGIFAVMYSVWTGDGVDEETALSVILALIPFATTIVLFVGLAFMFRFPSKKDKESQKPFTDKLKGLFVF
jgi:hypothetical protein